MSNNIIKFSKSYKYRQIRKGRDSELNDVDFMHYSAKTRRTSELPININENVASNSIDISVSDVSHCSNVLLFSSSNENEANCSSSQIEANGSSSQNEANSDDCLSHLCNNDYDESIFNNTDSEDTDSSESCKSTTQNTQLNSNNCPQTFLRNWSFKNNITHTALTEIQLSKLSLS